MKHLAILVTLLSALMLSACGRTSNEEAIAFVRSLPAQRIEQLAKDLNELRTTHPDKLFDQPPEIPEAFSDLHPISIATDSAMPRVHLSGSSDDKVLILLRDDGNGRQELVLLNGELQGETVLWQTQ